MSTFDIYSMFTLGFFGTGHCFGMCGPLIFAFPGQTGKLISHLYYHAGRILTYTVVGATLGAFGTAIKAAASSFGKDPLRWIAGVQVGFSLIAAGFLCMFGILRLGLCKEPKWMSLADPNRLPGFRKLTRSVLAGQSPGANFPLGILLGFLPCGLSFAAFARVLAVDGPLAGGLLVFAFGVGTLPGLLIFGLGTHRFSSRFRKYADLLSGVIMIGISIHLLMKSLCVFF